MSIATPPQRIQTVNVPIAADLAEAYLAAPNEVRRKWHALIEIYLRRFQTSTPETLDRTLRELGDEALTNGLTEREMNDILQDEDDAECH